MKMKAKIKTSKQNKKSQKVIVIPKLKMSWVVKRRVQVIRKASLRRKKGSNRNQIKKVNQKLKLKKRMNDCKSI
jgi:hypothetical protein